MASGEGDVFDFAASFLENLRVARDVGICSLIAISVDHRDCHLFGIVETMVHASAEPATAGDDALPGPLEGDAI